MNHRIGRSVFALIVGLVVAMFAYSWITNPEPRHERAQQEYVVKVSRSLLASIVASDALEIVDPLAPNRKVGKVYVYADPPGWAVSGYYRRGEQDRWHPYLITLTTELELYRLKVQDPGLSEQVTSHPELEIIG
jgi:hypothetical protein